MKNCLLFVLFGFSQIAFTQIKNKEITEISQEEFNTVFFLDVRTPEEFEAGHLPNAINLNWFEKDFEAQSENLLPKNQSIYVYCKSGKRSKKATKKLMALGYNVVNLTGGFDAYQKSKYRLN